MFQSAIYQLSSIIACGHKSMPCPLCCQYPTLGLLKSYDFVTSLTGRPYQGWPCCWSINGVSFAPSKGLVFWSAVLVLIQMTNEEATVRVMLAGFYAMGAVYV